MKRFTLGAGLLALLACAVSVALAHPVDAVAVGLLLANAPLAIGAEELKKLEDAIARKCGEFFEAGSKALKDEVSKYATISAKTNEALTEIGETAKKLSEESVEVKQRLLALEQAGAPKPGGEADQAKSAGAIFAGSDEYQRAMKAGSRDVPAVKIGGAHLKTAIVNALPPAASGAQPLVVADRVPGIIVPATRRLTIRDLLPQMRTNSNLVEFASENVYTNSAAVVFNSPDSRENVTKPESGITFTLSNAPVVTIAHWIPASRQVLADSQGLADYIDSRLMYGLRLAEEAQFLTGDGTGGNINGLQTQATTYNRGVSNDTMLDCLLKALLQVALSEYSSSGYVLNPIDWTQIRLIKDTTGRYLFGDPQSDAAARVWGLPVVATNSQTQGTFLTGAFELAAAVWDREDAEIRVSEHHDTFFVKNMVAVLAEERTTLTVYRTASIVKGTLPALGT